VAVEVLLPKLGLTMETGLIEEWLVPPGTPVKPGDLLLRLATDKVDVEVEAEGTGLFHPAVSSGVELPPGALIGWLLEAGEQVPSAAAAPTNPTAPAPTPDAVAVAVAEPPAVAEPGAITRTGRLFASPNARRVAGQRGVDIARLNGTGPGGRIITADVLEAPAASAPPASAPAPAAPAPKVVSPPPGPGPLWGARRGRAPPRPPPGWISVPWWRPARVARCCARTSWPQRPGRHPVLSPTRPPCRRPSPRSFR
jgi:pyruvate/2-oxoglutarate dehydrogenase complex dihydrolipoamide acyltransferase (E2) component